ncbi:farnesol dehydrogenase-like [Onthophagus taurus]|uniref:farnesol dehydrogenase-like n=1 Tax=Onthophagus taurus TaxID=166361 RepID=UPI0039BEBEAF
MERWRNKVAIVTGASSGIGAATAKLLVQNGLQVVGVARRYENIENLSLELKNQPGKLHSYRADMTIEADIISAFEWTEKNIGPVAILINNAGVARPTNIIDGDASEWRKVLDTNIFGVTVALREAIRVMRKHSIDGVIVNVNSVAGHFVPTIPLKNVYPASKYAVTALTETTRQELIELGSRIKVASISPGYVETEIASRNGFLKDKHVAEVEKYAPRLFANDIAEAIVFILSTPAHVQVTELTIRPVGEPV